MTSPRRLDLARWLAGHTRALLPTLALSALCAVLGQLLGIALLLLGGAALIAGVQGEPVLPFVGALIAVALAKAGLRYLEHFTGHWVAFTALQRLRELFFARLVPQAPAATSGEAGAELTTRATKDIDRIEVFFAHTFPPVISAVLAPAIALTWFALAVDAGAAAVLAAFVAAGMVVSALIAPTAGWAGARRVAARRADVAAHVADDVQGVAEVLAFAAPRRRLAGLRQVDDELVRERTRSGFVQGARAALPALLNAGALLAVVLIGGTQRPVEATLLALVLGVALWSPVRGVDDFASGLDAAFAAAARVREVVDAPPRVPDDRRRLPAVAGEPGVRVADVRFSYPGRAEVAALDDVSASFVEGRWNVVVGVSGSGKSTLATLLVRGWDPDDGQVRLAGVPVRSLGLDELRGRIAYVAQRPTVVPGTISENLRLAAPDAPPATLTAAVRAVGLEGWIAGLPAGMDTVLDARGRSVSGGQLQRLAIARAVVADPEVLVLDEALSQLDEATAEQVRAGLTARGGTVIEITHRVDRIADDVPVTVLDGGRVVQSGRAAELRATPGPFTQLLHRT